MTDELRERAVACLREAAFAYEEGDDYFGRKMMMKALYLSDQIAKASKRSTDNQRRTKCL